MGVPPCDPVYRRTIPPVKSGLLPADHLARRSTVARFWFFHSQAPTPEPVCHQRAASVPPSRDVAVLPLAVRTADSFRSPSPPTWNDPAPLLLERRSPIDGTTASDCHISRPAHVREVLGPQHLVRSAGSALPPARSDHNMCKPTWDEPDGSLSKWRLLVEAKLPRTPFVDIYEQLSVIPTTGPPAKLVY